jgi:hypothetical protein
MLDERPTAAELVTAVADFLEKKAAPELLGHTAFHLKVAINALRIVERELKDGDDFTRDERERLVALLDGDATELASASLAELNRALCERIDDGRLAVDDGALRNHLMRSALARMAIDSPKYPSLAAAPR